MERIEIDKNKALSPGDIVELHFRSIGLFWIMATQLAAIEYRLSREKTFRILNWRISDKNKIIFKVEVLQTNPVIVTAVVIAAAIAGVGVIAWLTLDKVYQILETPAGKIGIAGIGSLGVVAAIAGLLVLLPKGK